jgi:PucR C-terminal helix-turn-helix domain/GGDEF-like domain
VAARARSTLRMPLPAAAPEGAETFARLAAALEARLGRLAAAALARVGEKLPDLEAVGEDGVRQVGDLIRASLRAELRSFRQGAMPEHCPEVDAEAVSGLFRSVDLRVLEIAHRASQMALWGAWLELVEENSGLGARERRLLLGRGSDFFFAYAELQGDHVAEAHLRQLEQRSAGTEQRRFQAIKSLLEGGRAPGPRFDVDLDRHHLALIAWGEDPGALARRLAEELERPLLAVSPFGRPRSCWAWISGTQPLDAAAERTLAAFCPAEGRLALGMEGFGEGGFRASHRQAGRARRFASESGPALVRYEDVVVEALACENEDDARAFVAHELSGIADDSTASRRIRETLAAYFAAECNAASAGAALGIHQQTVANRLRSAEQRLGRSSIGVRRVELELALRLRSRLPVG